eukprot:TRINITY_DN23054_c0_g1_i1.p3 TRINITY_DN23054_c0_g1~~TRINITY_DN23054_c0_g1_i1.p3  ORF type:complete len:163 (+),score=20.99 TRINITY_DN23054_c0_g1_i1:465-953(+)
MPSARPVEKHFPATAKASKDSSTQFFRVPQLVFLIQLEMQSGRVCSSPLGAVIMQLLRSQQCCKAHVGRFELRLWLVSFSRSFANLPALTSSTLDAESCKKLTRTFGKKRFLHRLISCRCAKLRRNSKTRGPKTLGRSVAQATTLLCFAAKTGPGNPTSVSI